MKTSNTLPEKQKRRLNTKRAKEALKKVALRNPAELWDKQAKRRGAWVQFSYMEKVSVEEMVEASGEEVIKRASRREALLDGAKPTLSEVRRLKSFYVGWLMSDGDADCIPAYALADVADEEGHQGVALVLRTGYSFSGIETWLEGVFRSDEEALKHLRKGGWF